MKIDLNEFIGKTIVGALINVMPTSKNTTLVFNDGTGLTFCGANWREGADDIKREVNKRRALLTQDQLALAKITDVIGIS
jgi:hypothetical protein